MAQKGLGKYFRKGLPFMDIMRMFPDDAAAERWFAEQRWGDEPVCPRCESKRIQSGAKHPTMPYHCRDCRKYFSVRTGTVMAETKLGYQVWAIAIYLLTTGIKGTSSMKLHRELSITQKAAWHLAHRIRETWEDSAGEFAGPVEADETYIGGKESNKHARKKLRSGRGTVGKAAVAGVKDHNSNEARARVVEETTGPTLKGFVRKHAQDGAQVYTDENRAYAGLLNHKSVKHGVKEFVDGQAHTNGIESFWSGLKRGYYGTYHKMSVKHLDRYVREFSGRHNMRSFDTLVQMKAITAGMDGRQPPYKNLTADA